MNDDSDIDILIDVEKGTTYFDLGELYMTLTEKLNRKIDLLTKGSISSILKPYIEKDLIEIYNGN